jgi:hypothetical protein
MAFAHIMYCSVDEKRRPRSSNSARCQFEYISAVRQKSTIVSVVFMCNTAYVSGTVPTLSGDQSGEAQAAHFTLSNGTSGHTHESSSRVRISR